jgi:protocatechuate 3,4-dioxygenase beta subunit
MSSTGTNGSASGPDEPGSTNFTNTGNNTDHGTEAAGGTTVTSQPVTLTTPGTNPDNSVSGVGTSNTNVDFGIFQPLSLGTLVWNDANNDGKLDDGETGLANVPVSLLNSSGTVIASTTTNSSGQYNFTDLAPGTYSVRITPPSGYVSSTGTNGSASGPFEPGSTNDTDAGNGTDHGTEDAGGATVTSQPVTLTSVGSNPDSGVGGSGTANDNVDLGLFQPLRLGGVAWLDTNNDGLLDHSEKPAANLTVTLLVPGTGGTYVPATNQHGQPITTTTNASGSYLFTDLDPGQYEVELTPPASYTISSHRPNPEPGQSNANQGGISNGAIATQPVTLGTAGNTTTNPDDNGLGNLRQNFGLYPVVTVGSTIWHDNNENGLLDPSDPRLKGVVVQLYNTAGKLLATAVTNAQGQYLFSSDPNGTTTGSAIYNVAGLDPNTQYSIKLGASNFVRGGALYGYGLTKALVGSNPKVNSKGVIVNGLPTAVVHTGDPGNDNLIFNFGLIAPGDPGALSKQRYIH